MAAPTCESISAIFSTLAGSSNGDVSRFSTARTHPSLVWIPTAVEPNLIASMAYSTWNERNTMDSRKMNGGGMWQVDGRNEKEINDLKL